jgi:hypothetical protein
MTRLIVLLMVVLATACDGDGDGTTGPAGTSGPAITGARTVTSDVSSPIPGPDLVGLSASQARSELEAAGLRPGRPRHIYSSEPRGTVVRQDVDPGTPVRTLRRIRFTVTNPIPRPLFGSPWGYNFRCCTFIRDTPSEFCSYFKCIPYFTSGVGWVIQCGDRAFSQSGEEYFVGDSISHSQGSCYRHGGYYRELLQLRGRLVDPADRI